MLIFSHFVLLFKVVWPILTNLKFWPCINLSWYLSIYLVPGVVPFRHNWNRRQCRDAYLLRFLTFANSFYTCKKRSIWGCPAFGLLWCFVVRGSGWSGKMLASWSRSVGFNSTGAGLFFSSSLSISNQYVVIVPLNRSLWEILRFFKKKVQPVEQNLLNLHRLNQNCFLLKCCKNFFKN